MSKEIYISSTPHETRLAIVENDALTEIYYERENEYTLAGSIYNGKVTRVLPGMQSSFVDIGLERDAFLYITDFMEEAGDTADFDTNGNGDSSRRSDGRRGERNGNTVTLEGSLATSPDEANPARSDRGGRGDRGRGRGRGRDRDRGGNRDRQASPEPVPGSLEAQEGQNFTDEFNQPIESSAESAPVLSEDAVVGEGAPGADGARRWRGRRGRRRGRGPREESSQVAGEQTGDLAPEASGYEAPVEGDSEESFEIDAAASAPVSSEPVDSTAEVVGYGQENAGRSERGRNDGGRNDRGDRNNRAGRDRNDRGRGGRNDRGGREARVPRGFAPRVAFYGVDDAPAYNDATEGGASEPIILPGESLSKYRKDAETASSAPVGTKPVESHVIVPSAPGYVVPDGWDGGATLPGESLSRHRRSDGVRQPRAERRDRQMRATATLHQCVR